MHFTLNTESLDTDYFSLETVWSGLGWHTFTAFDAAIDNNTLCPMLQYSIKHCKPIIVCLIGTHKPPWSGCVQTTIIMCMHPCTCIPYRAHGQGVCILHE